MPLPLELKDAEHDTIVRVENNFNGENYVVGPFSFTPDTLRFDPDLWIASKNNTVIYDSLLSDPLIIFPNPAGDVIQISYQGADAVNEIAVYDVSGKRLKNLDAKYLGFYDPLALNVSNLSAGIYFLELKTSSSNRVGKFVKQ